MIRKLVRHHVSFSKDMGNGVEITTQHIPHYTPPPIGPTTYASPSQMASGSTPHPSEPDESSRGEGRYNETMRAVWINEGSHIVEEWMGGTGDDSQCLELDPNIWVAASGAPKKGHVYSFGHSLGTARVISSCSSSVSHATSPFTTPVAPGGSSSVGPTMTPDQFRKIINESVSQNILTIFSQTVFETLA
ncbi:hypothetical protein Taro_018842 [Colocasia esculenta]|uniref:Uncharacterized protein n=1 Tax=Colocasia esculenta TaxID=4460 RepID=A0A843USE9_COLES|nr:hypothetical protein [Colocasia esculenta]